MQGKEEKTVELLRNVYKEKWRKIDTNFYSQFITKLRGITEKALLLQRVGEGKKKCLQRGMNKKIALVTKAK